MKTNTKQTIMTVILAGLALLFAGVVSADAIYQTLPGTNIRDYSKPGLVHQGNTVYQTLPGSSIRDYSKPGYTQQGGTVYQTLPGTNIRDYSKPGYSINH